MEEERRPKWLRYLFQPARGFNFRKVAWALMAINILQAGAVALLLFQVWVDRSQLPQWSLVAMALFVIAGNLFLSNAGQSAGRYKQQLADLESVLRGQDDLNRQLRMQRHDFINHIQVVYALLQMGEDDKAQEYLEKVYSDLEKVGTHLRTESSAVNGLLAAKGVQAEKRGVKMDFLIETPLKNLPLGDWQLCRILSNLLDNAMDAAGEATRPRVQLRLWEDITGLHFQVTNDGPMIEKSLWERIFQPGFTTKGERGSGMGLAIVSSILEEHGGELRVESDPNETRFIGRLPYSLKAKAAVASDPQM